MHVTQFQWLGLESFIHTLMLTRLGGASANVPNIREKLWPSDTPGTLASTTEHHQHKGGQQPPLRNATHRTPNKTELSKAIS